MQIILYFINHLSNKMKSSPSFLMTLDGKPLETTIRKTMVIHLSDRIIEANSIEESDAEHNEELSRRSHTKQVNHEPAGNHQYIDENDRYSGADMRKTYLDKKMVQMTLVGTERRYTLKDSAYHHPQRVENRHTQHTQTEGYHTYSRMMPLNQRGIVYQSHTEDTHQHTHHQRTGISDKHLAFKSEHIVKEERDKRTCREGSHSRHCAFEGRTEHQSEAQTGEDTISTAETIHTIYQIDGIDDSATGDKGQR